MDRSGQQRVTTVIGVADGRRRAEVVAAVEAGGGVVAGEAATGGLLLALAEVMQPPLVVVDPDIAGRLGKGFVPSLLEAVPDARVAVLGPLVTTESVDLSRARVVDVDDLDHLGGIVAEVGGLLTAGQRTPETAPTR